MTAHHTRCAVDKPQKIYENDFMRRVPEGDRCPLFHYDDHKTYLAEQLRKYQTERCHLWTRMPLCWSLVVRKVQRASLRATAYDFWCITVDCAIFLCPFMFRLETNYSFPLKRVTLLILLLLRMEAKLQVVVTESQSSTIVTQSEQTCSTRSLIWLFVSLQVQLLNLVMWHITARRSINETSNNSKIFFLMSFIPRLNLTSWKGNERFVLMQFWFWSGTLRTKGAQVKLICSPLVFGAASPNLHHVRFIHVKNSFGELCPVINQNDLIAWHLGLSRSATPSLTTVHA